MLRRHEHKGPFWAPGDEENPMSGLLVIDKGNVTLDVVGDFGRELIATSARQRTYSLDLEQKARILGTSTDGKDITLDGVWDKSSASHFPGMATAEYRARAAIVGKHFTESEEIVFDEIAVSASDLEPWTRVSGFKTSIESERLDDKGHHAFIGAHVDFEAPKPIQIELSRGEKLELKFGCHGEGLWRPRDRVELQQETALHWRFARPVGLPSVFEKVGQIRDLLSLAVGRAVSITKVVGFQDSLNVGNSETLRPIEIYWEIPHNPEPPSEARHPGEMLFSLTDIPDVSTVFKRWLARQKRLEPVFNLYFGTLYHPDLFLEVRFLSLAQALETYDYRRRRNPGRFSLAERTHDVLAQCRKASERIVGSDAEAFVNAFKNSRNYYTHYNPKWESKAAAGFGLYLLTLQLQCLLEMSFLRQLGFGCRTVEQTLERAGRFRRISLVRSQAAEESSATAS
jgi:ApeA N-terminal domain 1